MLKQEKDYAVQVTKEMKGGPGEVLRTEFCTKDELLNHARLFGTLTLKKNCGIGVHEHKGESEIFHVLEGRAMYHDDGQEYEIKKGDTVICQSGHSHGVTNLNDETCVLMALIVLE